METLPLSVYLSVFERSPICECLLSVNEDPILLAVSDAFAEVMARPREALLGQRLFDTLPDCPDDPASLEGAHSRQALMRVLATGQPVTQPVTRHPGHTASAEESPERQARYWRLTDTPIFDGDGRMLCIVRRCEDVTDRLPIEQSMLQGSEHQRFMLSLSDRLRPLGSADEVIQTATEMLGQRLDIARVIYAEIDDPQGTFFVRTHWLNHGRSSIAGETRRLNDFGPRIIELLRAGCPMVVTDVTQDPRTRDYARAYEAIGVRANLAIPLVKAGRLTTVLSLQHDAPRQWLPAEIEQAAEVAERTWSAAESARAQQELQHANQRKDEFLAMLAHELRNPLAPLRVAADLLAGQQLTAALVRKTSEIIGRQVKHMTGLVDDLLDVSRVNRGLVTIEEAPQEMHAIVTTALEQARPLIEAHRHLLVLDLAAEPMQVRGDAKRLVQIVTNLVNNAAKYTPPGGRLHVALDSDGREVRLRVCDNGQGISKALQPHIFELFVQAQRTPDRRQGGLGIGLALVRSLVTLHRGTVTVFSEGPGQGSCFTVTLPRLADPSADEASATDTGPT